MSDKGRSAIVLLICLASALLLAPLAYLAAAAWDEDHALKTRIAALEARELAGPADLQADYRSVVGSFLPILPPDSDFRCGTSRGIVVFDPANFEGWEKGLEPEELNGVAVYPVIVAEDPETRETLFYNASEELIAVLDPEKDYNPFSWLELIHPEYYALDADPNDLAWAEALYDPARMSVTYYLLAIDDVPAMAEAQLAALEQAEFEMNMMMGEELPEPVTNLVIFAIEPTTNGIALGIGWPEDFTNKLEVFARSTIAATGWAVISTNLSTSGTNSLWWVDATVTSNTSTRFYRVGNADQDSDEDGLTDARERMMYGTDEASIDSDGDGLVDGYSGQIATNGYPGGAHTNGGIYVEGELTWGTDHNLFDTDGDDMGDGWEVANGHNPLDPNDPPNVAGTVYYAGRQTGTVFVVAVTASGSWATNHSKTLNAPGLYRLPNLPGTNYWLKAWVDSNGNGETNESEAWGAFSNNPVPITNQLTGQDIVLTDPDMDDDSLPDWWEIQHFGGITNWTGSDDPDTDQYDNLDEYQADTDPGDDSSHPWNISGTIAYAGPQTGTIYVVACTNSGSWEAVRYSAMTSTGAYTITHLPPGQDYWIRAWRDSYGDGTPAFWEAWGNSQDNPATLVTNLTAMDVTLVDADSDGDGLPDWWEVLYGYDPYNGGSPTAAAWWRMDASAGTNVLDSTSHANHGILVNGAPSGWTSGVISNALAFDGADDYVQIPDSDSLKPNLVSVSLWVMPSQDCTNGTATFFSKKESGGSTGYRLSYEQGALSFLVCASGEKAVGLPCNLASGVWHHVVGTYGGSFQGLYVDGTLVAQTNYSWGMGFGYIDQGTVAPRIGASPGSMASNFFAGAMDDVHVFAISLSSNQVYALYEAGSDADGDGLSAWRESQLHTSPTNTDSDLDGLSDNEEVSLGTDPADSDTDDDGLSDGFEIEAAAVVTWTTATDATLHYYGTNVETLATGDKHSLCLLADGRVKAWGANDSGQTNVPATVSNAVAIAAGRKHSLALLSNGTVVAWGNDDFGQSTVPTGLSNVTAVSAGKYHSVALLADGRVMAWGRNANGETNVPSSLTNAIGIVAGHYHNLALLATGRVVAWGYNGSGQTSVPPSVTNAVDIAVGDYHSLALLSNGRVVAWGFDSDGQSTVPSAVTNATAIAAGTFHSMARLASGAVMTWGDDLYGQTTVPPGLTDVRCIYGAGDRSLAADTNHVKGWGKATDCRLIGSFSDVRSRTDGECAAIVRKWLDARKPDTDDDGLTDGDEVNIYHTDPTSVDTDKDGLSDGDEVTLYHTDPTETDTDGDGLSDILETKPVVMTWYSPTDASVIDGSEDVAAIAAGDNHILALFADGHVQAWEYYYWWGDVLNVPEGLTNATAIAAGDAYSLALLSDGRVVAWGDNDYGQTSVPADLTNAIAISAGYLHGLALSSSGNVMAWGNNDYGQTSVPVDLTNAVAISAGYCHSLALRSDGDVTAWGANWDGMSTVPTNVEHVVAIAAGITHSLALLSNGCVRSWGSQTEVPSGLTNVVSIAVGYYHNLALLSNGCVVAWGDNFCGQSDVPSTLTNAVSIWASGYSSMAVTADGHAYGWGYASSLESPYFITAVCAQTYGESFGIAHLNTSPTNADTDHDMIPDGWEFNNGLSPLDPDDATLDPDLDGLNNAEEHAHGSNPHNLDSDYDGLVDGWSGYVTTNQYPSGLADTNCPGFVVGELSVGTLPYSADSDSDGMSDKWEIQHGFDPTNSADAALDSDDDGLVDWGTGLVSTNLYPAGVDVDHDGFVESEAFYGTSPYSVDSDGDGLVDGTDGIVTTLSYPAGIDANQNGYIDGELDFGSYGNNTDSDGDGLADGLEVTLGLNPVDADSNGNGIDDYTEYLLTASGRSLVAIAGTVTYDGRQGGAIWVAAETNSATMLMQHGATIGEPGPYAISNLVTLTNYWIKAYRDSNGNGLQDAWEAVGSNVCSPLVLTASVTTVNLVLDDPDLDGDSLPDWWERLIVDAVPDDSLTGIVQVLPGDDFDADGSSNLQEYQDGTDPTDGLSFGCILQGEVVYTGGQTGTVNLVLLDTSGEEARAVSYGEPSAFAISNVPSLISYRLLGWMDSNGNASNDAWEAVGGCSNDPVVVEGDLTNLVVVLSDPDNDGDGLPDWWEQRVVDASTNDAITDIDQVLPDDDFDQDGTTNGDEYRLNTDPLDLMSHAQLVVLSPAHAYVYLNQTNVSVSVDLSASVTQAVTVCLKSVGGTAVNGSDYTLTNTALTVSSGTTNIDFSLPVNPTVETAGRYVLLEIEILSGPAVVSTGAKSCLIEFLTSAVDSDADGMPDAWETAHGLNPNDPSDAAIDSDSDGLPNWLEYLLGTDPGSGYTPDTANELELSAGSIREGN